MCSGSWPLSTFWTRSGTTWLMASRTFPDRISSSPSGPALADAHAVERPDDRVGQPVLVPRGLGEVLHRELLEAVGRQRRRDLALLALVGRPLGGALEHHRGGQVGDLLQPALLVGRDGGVAGRRDDPLVGGQQVIGVGVEVGDTADHGRARDELVAVGQQPGHQADVPRVALHQLIPRMVVVGLPDFPVFGKVVHPNDGVPALEQLLDQVTADKSGRSTDHNLFHLLLSP